MSDKNLPLKNLIEVRNLKIVPRANPRYAILKGVDFEVKPANPWHYWVSPVPASR